MATATTQALRSNLGPLTTEFVPPSACSAFATAARVVRVPGRTENVAASQPFRFFQAQGCNGDDLGQVEDATTCWPPTTVTTKPDGALGGWGFYSPGLICPAGFTSACVFRWEATGTDAIGGPAFESTPLPSFRFDFVPQSNEAIVGCCPTGFQCGYDDVSQQTCVKLVSHTTFTTGRCGSEPGALSSLGLTTLSLYDSVTNNRSTLIHLYTYNTLQAPLFQLMYQPTDIPSLETSPAANSALSSAATSPSLTIRLTIALPVAMLSLALIVGLSGLIWRRRRRHLVPSALQDARSKLELPGNGCSELGTIELAGPPGGPEIDGTARAELSRDAGVHELPGGEIAQELWLGERATDRSDPSESRFL